MTDEAIRAGFDSLRPSADYDALYASARCRADADWLIGMNATRAYTIRYGVLLSIGRVQTPTLSMLVRRRREIDAFVPQVYYLVNADFGDYKGVYIDAKGEKKIATEEDAQAIAARVRGQQASVLEATREHKSVPPPLLYDLTTLQREANAQFGFTAEKTLETAQKLYEQHKLHDLSRERTAAISRMICCGKVQSTLAAYDGALQPLGEKALEYGVRMSKRIFDDAKLTDHHAIIPTGKKAANLSLTADERRLYELVAKRLAAVFYPNLRIRRAPRGYSMRTGSLPQHGADRDAGGLESRLCGGAGERRTARREEKEDEQPLPDLHPDDERVCRDAKVAQDQTKPPKEYNDASILLDMEHAGRQIEDEELREQMKDCALGTPATRAAIIERLISVGYVSRRGKNLTATEKGVHLIEAVPQEIASPETTGRWERALAEIARGSDGEQRFREGIARLAAFLVQNASGAPDVAFAPEERRGRTKRVPTLGVACPLCGKGKVAENSKGFYCTRFRDGCKFTIWKNELVRAGGPELTAKLLKLCMEKRDVRGSTGIIHYENGAVRFTPMR